jgi:hypothetical protein
MRWELSQMGLLSGGCPIVSNMQLALSRILLGMLILSSSSRSLARAVKLRSELLNMGLQQSLPLPGLSLLAQDTVNIYRT